MQYVLCSAAGDQHFRCPDLCLVGGVCVCVVPAEEKSKPVAADSGDAKDVKLDSKHSKQDSKWRIDSVAANELRACSQLCGKQRVKCAHKCTAFCHPHTKECPDVTCEHKITIFCACKRLSENVPCGLGGDAKGLPLRSLECDDQCEVEQRNARFRDALQVDESIRGVSIPYPAQFLEQIMAGGSSAADGSGGDATLAGSFLEEIESVFDEFVNDSSTSSHHLKSVRPERRWLVHQMAPYYQVATESFNTSGSTNRSMRLIKESNRKPIIPRMLLSEAIELYRTGSGTAPGSKRPRTVDVSCLIEFRNLQHSISDVKRFLSAYSGQYRLTWLREGAAVAMFSDQLIAADARADLEKRHSGLIVPLPPAVAAAVAAKRAAALGGVPLSAAALSAAAAATGSGSGGARPSGAPNGDAWDTESNSTQKSGTESGSGPAVKQNWDDADDRDPTGAAAARAKFDKNAAARAATAHLTNAAIGRAVVVSAASAASAVAGPTPVASNSFAALNDEAEEDAPTTAAVAGSAAATSGSGSGSGGGADSKSGSS